MRSICIVFHSSDLSSGATKSMMHIVDFLLLGKEYKICAVFPSCSGTAIDYLKNKNVENVFFAKYGGLMQDLRQSFLKRFIKMPLLFYRHLVVRKEARRVAKAITSCDLVYSNTSTIILGGYLGDKLKSKQIWHIREFGKKDHRICFYLGSKYIKRFINKRTEAVFFVSNAVRETYLDYIDSKKCFVTYNSYPKSFIWKKDCFFDKNIQKKMLILLAGDVRKSKGQLNAVLAAANIKKVRPDVCFELLLAGNCGDNDYLLKVLDAIKLNSLEGNVKLLGHRSDMHELRKTIDVGLCCSDNEAFGRTVIEGMLSEIAMIGKKSGGTIEQIKDYQTGVFYDGSVEQLSSKIIELYDNPVLLKTIATNGFEFAVDNFTNDNSARIVKNEIENLFNN